MKKASSILYFLFILHTTYYILHTPSTYAASLQKTSDKLSTSRPSSSTVLSVNQKANDLSLVVSNTNSIFLEGDLIQISGIDEVTYIGIVSSVSQNTPTSTEQTIFLNTPVANPHRAGSLVTAAIPALHTIQFTPSSNVPVGGKIIITFQGPSNNSSSPQESGFAFNGLTALNIQVHNATCSFSISAPAITCTLTSSISSGTKVTILIGCAKQEQGSCLAPNPTLINPTKLRTQGDLDPWNVSLKTTNSALSEIDRVTTKIGIIEPVQMQARIEPSLQVAISGLESNQPVNSGNTQACLSEDKTPLDSSSTSTAVNLGKLQKTPISPSVQVPNIAAQLIKVTTNTKNGYVLKASSNTPLQSSQSGFSFPYSTTPQPFSKGKAFFGIHPCGADVMASLWVGALSQTCNTLIQESGVATCKYAWPNASNSLELASDLTGPVGIDVSAGNGVTTIEYAAGIDSAVAGGRYSTNITYTVLPGF